MSTTTPLVMVVDDDNDVRCALKRMFRSVGYAVRTFADAHQLLAHGRPTGPCCLILDVHMPGINGLQFQQFLAERGIRIPIVFLTGFGDIPMCAAAMKAGAIDFMPKPFNPERLLAAVAHALDVDAHTLTENLHVVELRHHFSTLTLRERAVFELVVTGLLNKQVASELHISEKTVKIHRGRVMKKMQTESLAQLVRAAEAMERARRSESTPAYEFDANLYAAALPQP